MTIEPYSQEYFRFSLSPEEKKSAAGKKMLAELKEKFAHGERYWIREDAAWAIRVEKLDDFLELVVKFICNRVVTGQGVLFQ